MSNLVIINDGQIVVTSRQIAENFEKEHRVVLKAIDDLIAEMGVAQNYADLFIPTEYQHEQNKQMYREYLLTRDGFGLLVMGFTGSKALEWKLKYIEAFNEMEKQISDPYKGLSQELKSIFLLDKRTQEVTQRVEKLENDLPLFNVECKELQSLVRKIGTKALGGYKSQAYQNNSLRGKVYSDIQHQLKREFGVSRYEAIKRSQLDTARKIVIGYTVPMILADEIKAANNQLVLQGAM
jgi:Rha family phage regulatory protein